MRMVGSAKQATTNCAAVVVVGCTTTAVACLLLHAVVAAGQRRRVVALKKEVERQEELRSAAHAGRVKAEKVDEELNSVSQMRYFLRVFVLWSLGTVSRLCASPQSLLL